VIVVAPPALKEPKTKPVADYLKTIGLAGKKVLWVTDRTGEAMLKSARNLARVDTVESTSLHPYSLMKCETLVLTEDGLKSLTERLHEKAEARSGAKAKETR
jgi:large subunit ribosomal protein L4